MSDGGVLSPVLDFRTFTTKGSKPKQYLVPPEGSQSAGFTVGTSGGSESVFRIPRDKAWNPSLSFISFTLTPQASGAGFFNCITADTVPFWNNIVFRTTSGARIVELNSEPASYFKMIKGDLTLDEYLDNDTMRVTLAAAQQGSHSAVAVPGTPTQVPIRATGTTVLLNATASSYNEPLWFYQGPAAGNTSDPVLKVLMPLREWKGTFFELNKMVSLDEQLELRLNWAMPNRYCFIAATADAAQPSVSGAPYVGTVAISNLNLFIAQEDDPAINAEVMSEWSSGKAEAIVPFVYGKYESKTGTKQSNSMTFGPSYGLTLSKMYFGGYNATNTGNTCNSTDNRVIAGTGLCPLITDFQTKMDSVSLQNQRVVCKTNDAYRLLRPSLRNCAVIDDDMYNYDAYWVDRWDSAMYPGAQNRFVTQNQLEGMPIDKDHTWSIDLTTVGSLNHAVYAVFMRKLRNEGGHVIFE